MLHVLQYTAVNSPGFVDWAMMMSQVMQSEWCGSRDEIFCCVELLDSNNVLRCNGLHWSG